MKKFEVIVDDTKGEELTSVLRNLPYVKDVKESKTTVDPYTIASEASLAEDWLSEEDDELQNFITSETRKRRNCLGELSVY